MHDSLALNGSRRCHPARCGLFLFLVQAGIEVHFITSRQGYKSTLASKYTKTSIFLIMRYSELLGTSETYASQFIRSQSVIVLLHFLCRFRSANI